MTELVSVTGNLQQAQWALIFTIRLEKTNLWRRSWAFGSVHPTEILVCERDIAKDVFSKQSVMVNALFAFVRCSFNLIFLAYNCRSGQNLLVLLWAKLSMLVQFYVYRFNLLTCIRLGTLEKTFPLPSDAVRCLNLLNFNLYSKNTLSFLPYLGFLCWRSVLDRNGCS